MRLLQVLASGLHLPSLVLEGTSELDIFVTTDCTGDFNAEIFDTNTGVTCQPISAKRLSAKLSSSAPTNCAGEYNLVSALQLCSI